MKSNLEPFKWVPMKNYIAIGELSGGALWKGEPFECAYENDDGIECGEVAVLSLEYHEGFTGWVSCLEHTEWVFNTGASTFVDGL